MEYLSSSKNPNNQERLPPEALQIAHDESAARLGSPISQHTSAGELGVDSDFTDINQRSRKKQKAESNDYQSQIDKLQHEIAEVKERLASPKHHSSNAAHELGKSCIEAKQTAATMQRKLAEHSHWLQRVSSLIETAPLFDYALGASEDNRPDPDASFQRSMEALAEWRGESKGKPHPRLILDERLRAAVNISQENASRLLRDATENAPTFQLSLKFDSHGWEIATGVLMNDHMGFCCHRVLPAELIGKAKEVAMAFWNFVQRDDIFRTFVPLVQDSIVTHQERDCSLSCRVLQLSQEMNQQAVATVESISSIEDDEGPWVIVMEAVHDHYLCTFVADASGDSVIPNTAPPVKLDLGLQLSKLNMHNKFIFGARVSKTDEGVDIHIAGSARFDLPCYRDPAFDLLQHFVSHLPVYEDLHLTPLGDVQEKPQVDV
ncbi:hypothetical protein DVH05_022346 [Phytophthora capsici]|nr:hypothetical protein DVH05_022346 [Phytophthora capsici]|eukprot:jgi/Phyca11/547766/estExt2_Genewise1Plus.C_PHYCAscaffold_260257